MSSKCCLTIVSSVGLKSATFTKTEIKYLGYIISSSGVSMDPSKIKAVQELWPAPRNQYDENEVLRPIAFYARQMNSAEQNYEIYDKELLAVVESFQTLATLSTGVDCMLEVLNTVFVEEDDWPLVIADFLAGSDNVWMADVTEQILGRCKTELPHFRFRDDTFVRILPDGKSTATYVRFSQRTEVMRHYHESLAHLKFGSIIDLVSRRFWWPKMKADLRNYILPLSTMPARSVGFKDTRTTSHSSDSPSRSFPLNVGESISMAHGRNQIWKQVT
ncbi:hypothetical protein BASA83_006933 [Batrachochytrium salamandrivorans]|nr:hypothetical protein BASA83_006933 [Batrachochytrium salamandrivorans]